MNSQLNLFQEDFKEKSQQLLAQNFKTLWKEVIKKEKLSGFNENPKKISSVVKKMLEENQIPCTENIGGRKGKKHDFLSIPGKNGEIIIDCKNRKFNIFGKRVIMVEPESTAYDEYLVLKRK